METTKGMTNKEIRDEIDGLLRGLGESLMADGLIRVGFYDSPCSGGHHLAEIGGLARHSLNVLYIAQAVADVLDMDVDAESVIRVCLLHDLGKVGQFDKPGYIPNMLKGRATKANPNPLPVQSTAKPFAVNPALLPVAHEVRSLAIAAQYIDLTEEEQFAILYHNGMYSSLKYDLQGHETPLQMLLHFADMWASRVVETEEQQDED